MFASELSGLATVFIPSHRVALFDKLLVAVVPKNILSPSVSEMKSIPNTIFPVVGVPEGTMRNATLSPATKATERPVTFPVVFVPDIVTEVPASLVPFTYKLIS
jgi:hypothetical protein